MKNKVAIKSIRISGMILLSISSFVSFANQAEAREFSNRQFWNVPAIRYQDSKASCLDSTKGWATDGVRHECKVAFHHAPAYVKLCEAAEVEIRETEYTDRYGTECSTTATIQVK